jgi:hypothetical protein
MERRESPVALRGGVHHIWHHIRSRKIHRIGP